MGSGKANHIIYHPKWDTLRIKGHATNNYTGTIGKTVNLWSREGHVVSWALELDCVGLSCATAVHESLSSLLKLLSLWFSYLKKKMIKVTHLIRLLCGINKFIYRKHSEQCLEYRCVLWQGFLPVITMALLFGGNVLAKSNRYCWADIKHDSILKARHIY